MKRYFIHRYRSGDKFLVCSPLLTEWVWRSSARDALDQRAIREARNGVAPTSLSLISSYVEIQEHGLAEVDRLLTTLTYGSDVLDVPGIASVAYNPPRGPNCEPPPIPKTNHKIGVPKNKLP